MDEVEKLIEEYISPEQAMFRYGKEKKIELIYEKNKDKEEKKIRNEILKKLLDFIENDSKKDDEKTEKREENDCTSSAITASVECKNDMTCSEKKGLIDQKKKNKKLIDIIMYLKKYNFCNENIKRGTSVNLISQLFEEIDFIELEIEYFRAIVHFFIKKIEDWHCINGVLNFFLIIFDRYKNQIEEMRYSDEVTEEYKELFISKNKKGKNNMNTNDKNKIIGSGNEEINENTISNYYNNYNSENESDESWRSSCEGQHERYNRRDNDFEESENEEESEDEKIKENSTCIVYKIMKTIFKHVFAPSYLQIVRLKYYKIILISLEHFKNEIQNIPNFINKIQVQLEGESDPRNILVLFDIIYILCNKYILPLSASSPMINIYDGVENGDNAENEEVEKEYASGIFSWEKENEYLKSLIDIAFYYFPIEFINNDGRYDCVSEKDLQDSFIKCLKSNKRLGSYIIVNILDHFYNSENEEISEKNLKNILSTLKICVPFYGSDCCSQYITTVLGLIELECIENNSDENMINYLIDILLTFINLLNKENNNKKKYNLFNKYFINTFKKYQTYIILHRCMYEGIDYDISNFVNLEKNDILSNTDSKEYISSFFLKNKDEEKGAENVCELDKEVETKVDKKFNIFSNGIHDSELLYDWDISEDDLNIENGEEYGKYDYDKMEGSENSDKNLLSILKEKNEIDKINEQKEKEKKKNKIKVDKFYVIEKILTPIASSNTYIFLFILKLIIIPIIKECYCMIKVLNRQNDNKEKDKEKEKIWNLFVIYIKFVDNLIEKSVNIDEVASLRISFIYEIYTVINMLNDGKSDIFHNYHNCGLQIFNIFTNFLCMHNIGSDKNQGKKQINYFSNEIKTINDYNKIDNWEYLLFYKSLLSFFYIIEFHPFKVRDQIVMSYKKGRTKKDEEESDKHEEINMNSFEFIDIWRKGIIKDHINYVNDIKENNENILNNNKNYKKNDLFYFLILINKIIKYKYKHIQNYIHFILFNLSFFIIKLYYSESKNYQIYKNWLAIFYEVNINYMIFLTTNISSFILRHFYNYVNRMKNVFLKIHHSDSIHDISQDLINTDLKENDNFLNFQNHNSNNDELYCFYMTSSNIKTKKNNVNPLEDKFTKSSEYSSSIEHFRNFIKECDKNDIFFKQRMLNYGSKSVPNLFHEVENKMDGDIFDSKVSETKVQAENSLIKIVINEKINKGDIIPFYFSFLLHICYFYTHCLYEKSGDLCESDSKIETIENFKEKKNEVNNKIRNIYEGKEELYSSYMYVNIFEIVELCIKYIYEEKIVRDIFIDALNKKKNIFCETNKYGCINLINDNEDLCYYSTYINVLKNYIKLNEIKNVNIINIVISMLEDDQNDDLKDCILRFLNKFFFFTNILNIEMDSFLYLLNEIVLMYNLNYRHHKDEIICDEKVQDIKKNKILSTYLYNKAKSWINHIFIFLNNDKKTKFLKNIIINSVNPNKAPKKKYNIIPIQDNYIFNEKFKNFKDLLLSSNPALLLFIPYVVSSHIYIEEEYTNLLLKLCIYIFLFNIYKESVGSKNEETVNDEVEHVKEPVEYANILTEYKIKNSSIYLKGDIQNIFGEEDIKKSLNEINLELFKNLYKSSLTIISVILAHSYINKEDALNFVYQHFDKIQYLNLSTKSSLLYKNIIDQYTEIYKSFIHIKKGENFDEQNNNFYIFLSKLFEVNIDQVYQSNDFLFFLFDQIYFINNNTEIGTSFYQHIEKCDGEIRIVGRSYLKGNSKKKDKQLVKINNDNISDNNGVRYNWECLEKIERNSNKSDSLKTCIIKLTNLKNIISKKKKIFKNAEQECFYLNCHFFFSIYQIFQTFYDLTFYIKNNEQNDMEENLENLYENMNSKDEKFTYIIFYFHYMSYIYEKIYHTIHQIDTNTFFEEHNYNKIYFIKSIEFFKSYKTILINFMYTLYNYLYFIQLTNKYITITEFLFMLNDWDVPIKNVLPYYFTKENEKIAKFVNHYCLNDKICQSRELGTSSSLGANEDKDCTNLNENCKNILQILRYNKKENRNKYNCKYISLIHIMSIFLLNMTIEEVLTNHYNVMKLSILKGINKVANFFINKSGYLYNNKRYINNVLRKNINIVKDIFSDTTQNYKNKEKRILVKKIISLNILCCLRLLYLIFKLLNYFLKHENKNGSINLESSEDKKKNSLNKYLQFLLSYKNIIIKSVMKIMISVPFGLIRYLCVCIFYLLSFYNYQSFLSYSIIQDINWNLSVASNDPHKNVRKIVMLCRSRWM
ncbi:conserved Plasmodium protein, unknown function [Plasmodium vinckei lentum]|uniref:MMS19 nucleotide excision repair protein n=1 Tax=Plasmodium vinckei lentum TaxID=138297 RepID=A0A6V7S9W8_PLAVN|nr:conserved Plasmodium protein, unknown function [Plasmodium vinckei lentum]